ncbi:hypothetical protein J2X02_003079 [Pseudoxanthomonas japonensis]|jgi:hypothetical protein|uniref:hypothetical protein n=1 Tax=Pseudoxanthomonas japonensis TaxID=69284 RepID=UPI001A4518C4|nr:hypothetical protein [Pseudoxanthomonas japonensis]MBA3931021.1 hypothetical protein [Xanthomonas sp.]MBL8255624.1 hypothetical protein [Pseudoxanthomonas mexicana]MDR7070214.1 hypothetical protein [Pseudoxanthomonas japonensis]
MNQKLTHILPSLAVGGLLLTAGTLAGLSGARTAEAESAALVGALESDVGEITGDDRAPATSQHKRRARASLAMPYFSFGQSLRPRS